MFEIDKFFRDFFKHPEPEKKGSWVSVYESMAVHTRKAYPKKILETKRPNEEKPVLDYRLSVYRPITYGSMNKALDSIYRILNGITFHVNAPEQTKNFIQGKNFDGFALKTYFEKIVLKRSIEDPNGYLVWLPGGEGVENTSEKAVPTPLLVYSSQIHYKDENVFSFISDESAANGGKVFYVLTKDEFYKVVEQKENTYQPQLIYEHGIGELPVVVMGGDWNAYNYYESFFAPYLAFGDEAICQFSDWQAIMVTSSFPYIEEFATECEIVVKAKDASPSDSEEIYQPQTELRQNHATPYGVHLRKVGAKNDDFNTTLPVEIPGRRYIHPDIEIAKYSGESWSALIDRAEDSLHLNLGQTNQSGTAKELDKEGHYSMISKIGNNFYDNIYFNSLVYIDAYYNYVAARRSAISIDKPSTFKVKTESDLVEELSVLKEKKVPSFFLTEASMDLAHKRFSGNVLALKIFEVISYTDPFSIYTIEEKTQLLLNTICSKEQFIYSMNIFIVLKQVSSEMGVDKFLEADIAKIRPLINAKMLPLFPQPELTVFNADGSITVNRPQDPNRLAELVGGLTGMLEIVKAVAEGYYEIDAAVALAAQRFGISEDEARKQIGNPKPINPDITS